MTLGNPIGNEDEKQEIVETKKGDLFKIDTNFINCVTAGFYTSYKDWLEKNTSKFYKFNPKYIILEYIGENTFVEYLTKTVIRQIEFNKIEFDKLENGIFIDSYFGPLNSKFNYSVKRINNLKEIAEIYGGSIKNTEYCYKLLMKFVKYAKSNLFLYQKFLKEEKNHREQNELTLVRRGREIQEKYGRRQ